MEVLKDLANLSVEYWRLLRMYERAVKEQAPEKQFKASAQLRYSIKKLHKIMEKNGMRLITYEEKKYTPNLPVTVLNGDDFDDNEKLIIDQTLEPTIIESDQVLMFGKVVVRKEGEK